ncbi:MAG: DNA primase [Gammaproteobacteria bacterium]
MTGRIPKSFIADLLNKVDIVDVVDSRVPLKKAGSNYVACCPFHNEKSPSFTVSPSKQFYHCFGCGSHGSAISFIMAYDRLEYVEAIESLAAQLGLAVPHENTGNQYKTKTVPPDLYQYLVQAANYYQAQLASAQEAQDYLQKRGLSAQIIQRFSLGYAPAGWGNLADQFAVELHPSLEKIGLLVKNKLDRYHDRFRERIMYPIRDQRGRVLGFGGRITNNQAASDQPKYLNSPETPLFHKGSILYGLYEALQTVRDLKRVLVVEGYMDVIALAQYGVPYAVAAMGTAATRQHLERLFRHTSVIIFCFDGDNAGKNAAKRALETVLPLMEDGRQVKFMFLPEAHDPDSLIRAEGLEAFQQRIDTAMGVGEYCFSLLQLDIDMASLDGRAKFTKLASDLIETIPNGTFRELMITELAKKARVGQENLPPATMNSTSSSTTPARTMINNKLLRAGEGRPTPMRLAIALLLQHPELIHRISFNWTNLPAGIPGAAILQQLISLIREQPNLSTAALLEWWREHLEYNQVSKLAAMPFTIPEGGVEVEFDGALQQLARMSVNYEIEQLMQKAASGELDNTERQHLQRLIRENKE